MNRVRVVQIITGLLIPVTTAFIFHFLFDLESRWTDVLEIMSFSFLFFLPLLLGVVTMYVAPLEKTKKIGYRIREPWIPVVVFATLSILTAAEGWACWIMMFPLFILISSLGGLLGGYLRNRKSRNAYLSVLVLLPFICAPIEAEIGKSTKQYRAYTVIDIKAPKEKIWALVTRVQEIKAEEDHGWLTRTLGFPRPLRAELNFEGVGAFRKAVFDKGLVFDETVLAYEHQRMMKFSIHANTYDIPSTTLDEHVVVGGEFFDVLDGTYELEQLSENTCRLHLYSHFRLNTTFNFYAGWWASWIMRDIQQNILQVIRTRAQQG